MIDLRWLSPLPDAALVAALKGCSHALVVDETRATGGLSEALMTLLAEKTALRSARLAAYDSFIAPSHKVRAASMIPSVDGIVAA